MRARVIVVFVFVAMLGITIDLLLDYLHVSRSEAAILENSLTGMGVAIAYYLRRRAMGRRVRVIADLNHEIRNALHVVVLAQAVKPPDSWQIVSDANKRIEKSLRTFNRDF